ncbi:MAG: hypothetical protein WCA36_03645 [Pseudolabrys sp.]
MSRSRRPTLATAFVLALFGLGLGGCATSMQQQPTQPAQPAPEPSLPGAFPATDLIGSWGLAAYHQAADRDRTVKAAANQCTNPYVITPGPNGGVMMHLADEANRSDLVVKGNRAGKTFIGPPGPPGGMQDREVVSFDGRVLILRWMDPEVQGRYGTMVYAKCAPEHHTRRRVHHRRRPAAKPKPK